MPSLPFRGCFINLEKNHERLELMNRQLEEARLSKVYERVPAVNGYELGPEYETKLDRGNLGLWLTHERLVAAHQFPGLHLHILEDDAMVPVDAGQSLSFLVDAADRQLADWDIIFTDLYLPPDVNLFRQVAEKKEAYRQRRVLELYPLKQIDFACTSSLLLNRNSIEKYLKLISGRWKEGAPIDLYLRALVQAGLLNGYFCLPFITSISVEANRSSIRGNLDLSREVMNVYRRSIYKDADLKALREELNQLMAGTELSDLSEFYVQIIKFFVSSRYITF